ncbi:MAG: FG-GAP-like repeat-containing protein [candidate division WOR-3 bacterium]
MKTFTKSHCWMVFLCITLPIFLLGNTNIPVPAKMDSDWLTTIQQKIKESEYEIRWQDKAGCYQSPNRAQNLRFSYYLDGFKAEPRVYEKDNFWSVIIKLISVGRNKKEGIYQGDILKVDKNKAEVIGNLLKIDFENMESGMRQNFVVSKKLKGKGNLNLNLTVELLGVEMNVIDDKISFIRAVPGGSCVMNYLDMKVSDANGKIIPAHFEKSENGFKIVIEDANAVYPITVDPLSQTPNWTSEGNQILSFYGIAVASAGDVNGDGYSDVIVGAEWFDNGQEEEGRAFVYHGSATGLPTSPNWTNEPNQAYAHYGYAVSCAGDINGDGYQDVLIGAPGYDAGFQDVGAAYLYYGSASGLSNTAYWIGQSNQANAHYGNSLSCAGDVNGDGYSDVIVGAPDYDNGQTDEGMAFVYYGSPYGLPTSPNWTGESNQASAYYGISVSTAGDVNGDGYSDVIIGAHYYDGGQTNEGRVYVYHGSASGLATSPNWTGQSNQADAHYGTSVACAGDVNGDGYSDVIIGIPEFDNNETDEGRAYVYHGSASGLSTLPTWSAEPNVSNASFGRSVATAGDINGDGYADVIVGAPLYTNGQGDEGAAFVYHGSASGLSTAPMWTNEANQNNAYFGFSVSTAGDVNGDGYADVIVGAPFYTNGQDYEGAAFVYHGSASGLSTTPMWTNESNQNNAYFGFSVSTAGDVNGDGYSDVIIGAHYYDNGETDEGRAFVYHGSAAGLSTTPNWTGESNQPSAYYGISVSTAGDVNGDGYSDVIVGAYFYDNGESNEGRAFVYYGNEAMGVNVKPEQMRPDFSRQIVPPLFTYSNNSFGSRLFGRSSYGRVIAKAQFEVKPLGVPFNGIDLVESNWINLGTTGQQISRVITGLSVNTCYKWRARIKYHPKYGSPIHSRWYYIQSNGLNETDFRTGIQVGINEDNTDPTLYEINLMANNSPGKVRFKYSGLKHGNGTLVIYNILGSEVNRFQVSGTEYEWHGKDKNGNTCGSGVYFARIISLDSASNSVKFIFLQ